MTHFMLLDEGDCFDKVIGIQDLLMTSDQTYKFIISLMHVGIENTWMDIPMTCLIYGL